MRQRIRVFVGRDKRGASLLHQTLKRNPMKHHTICLALAATVLLLDTNLSLALESKTDEPPATIGGMQSTPRSKQAIAERRKANAKLKRVDINNASVKQLKTLPGIGDDEAARIIAGRPYGSKAWLATQKIIPDGIYVNIKKQIFVGPASKAEGKIRAVNNSPKKP